MFVLELFFKSLFILGMAVCWELYMLVLSLMPCFCSRRRHSPGERKGGKRDMGTGMWLLVLWLSSAVSAATGFLLCACLRAGNRQIA